MPYKQIYIRRGPDGDKSMDHNYGSQMAGFSKELYVIQKTIAINDDIK